jgi:hypothetical protein
MARIIVNLGPGEPYLVEHERPRRQRKNHVNIKRKKVKTMGYMSGPVPTLMEMIAQKGGTGAITIDHFTPICPPPAPESKPAECPGCGAYRLSYGPCGYCGRVF